MLIPFIEQVTLAFEKKNEEQTDATGEWYDFRKCYNRYNLMALKSDAQKEIDEPLAIINNIIDDFVKQSKIPKSDFIDLLIDKTNRDYKSHHIVDIYIDDYIDNPPHEEKYIEYLERENSMKLIVDANDKENLNKLLKLNIRLRQKRNSVYVIEEKRLSVYTILICFLLGMYFLINFILYKNVMI